MAKSDASGGEQATELKHMAEDVFSSEKREDIWAIIIALVILIFSIAFPDQIHYFFNTALYLF